MRPTHNEKISVGVVASVLSTATFFTILHSDRSFASDGATLDEVVVSATRRDTLAKEVSAAVITLSAARVRREKLVSDALSESPGVYLQQTTPGQGSAIIRGVKGSSILHLVDGMRLNNAIFRSAPTQYFSLIPVTAVKRIESIRGTPASLYGSDAIGGTVQVVTRVPTFESATTTAKGELFAAFDDAELGRTLRGTLDVGNRNVAASLSVEHLQTGNRRVGGGDRVGPSGYESRGGRFAVALNPDSEQAWLFDVHYLEQPATPRVDELIAGFGQGVPSSSEFMFAPNRRIFAHARYERTRGLSGVDWRFDASWQRIEDDRISREFGSELRNIEDNRSDLTGAMLMASRSMRRGSWIAGLEFYHDRVRSRRNEVDIGGGPRREITPRFPDGASVDQAAGFVSADLVLTGRQALGGGIRVSRVDLDLPATPVSAATNLGVTDFSGDLGWRIQVGRSWQLVANAGFGFRAPNVFDLGTLGNRPGNRFNIPSTALDSERVEHFDLGVRRHSDSVKLEFVLYRLDYDDRIVSVSTGDTTPDGRDVVQSVNAAASRIHGAEFAASFALSDAFSLNATVDYTRGEQQIAGVDEPADRIPPLAGRIAVDYASGPLEISAWMTFNDAQQRLSARDVRDVRIDPNGTAGWAVGGVRGRWQTSSKWELALGVDNLLDRRYRSHGSGIDAPGRNLSLSARYTW